MYNPVSMSWTVTIKESVIDDLRWFGRRDGRVLLHDAEVHLSADPGWSPET